jgi:dynein light chain 1
VVSTLKACERLALSTNLIDRMVSLAGMENLKILSLSRNMLKKIEKLEDVGGTMEELWLSYNLITSLDGLAPCTALRVLYIGNNKISDWGELDKLSTLPSLKDVLLQGNPIYDSAPDPATARLMAIKRLPNVDKLDNQLISGSEREKAAAL